MQVDEILERNRRYVKERQARPLPPSESVPLIVLACIDPRLDELLRPALGLEARGALWVRTPGAYVPPDGGTLRSLMTLVFLFGVTELLVVGHTSCRMAAFDAGSFIDAFRARGVRRDAFGSQDLRDWAGAIPSPRAGVELSMQHLKEAPICPRDLSVSGLILDDTRGSLELVLRAVHETEDETERSGPEAPPKPAAAVPTLADAVEELARVLRSNKKWGYEVGRLRQQLTKARSPAERLHLLSSFVQNTGSSSGKVVKAFERVRQLAGSPEKPVESLSNLLQQLATKL